MFGLDFYPTPPELIQRMIFGHNLAGAHVLEPSAGNGNIVEVLKAEGASVQACEIDSDLRAILKNKCAIIENDFLELKAEKCQHLEFIFMNPPFSRQEEHILHAWDIAPPGCVIVTIANSSIVKNAYSDKRKVVFNYVENFGQYEVIKNAFSNSERETNVEIVLIQLIKPGAKDNFTDGIEFDMNPEPEHEQEGLISSNFIREIVGRYRGAMRIYSEQLETATKLKSMLDDYCGGIEKIVAMSTEEEKQSNFNTFDKHVRSQFWQVIIRKMKMEKISTSQTKADIETFVNRQIQVPFTERNIYKMLEVIIGTTESRMDKALEIAFDTICNYSDDNKYYPGEKWKTNSVHLVNKKFIIPYMMRQDDFDKKWNGNKISAGYGGNYNKMEDLVKALCFITGDNFDDIVSLENFVRYPVKVLKDGLCRKVYSDSQWDIDKANNYAKEIGGEVVEDLCQYGQKYTWAFFEFQAYKKGTVHFWFKDEKLWERFNAKVSKIKGYPLFETSGTKTEAKKPRPEAPATENSEIKIVKIYKIKTT